MFKWFFLFLCLSIGIIYFFFLRNSSVPKNVPLIDNVIPTTTISPTVKVNITKETTLSLFVPYWSVSGRAILENEFSTLYYFGIVPNDDGINKKDPGYTKLSQFNKDINGQRKTILTIRMIDSSFNSKLLQNKDLQKKIIQESILVAKEHNFSGIALDYELSALAF